ncbi:MAG: hypothetical protein WA919_18275, partial [Coleofasciculaceae cyanobacterium]
EEFLPNESQSPLTEVSINSVSRKEFVKVMVVGSRPGIKLIIRMLHHLRFAEINEWSPPVSYGESGEVMSLVRKKVILE